MYFRIIESIQEFSDLVPVMNRSSNLTSGDKMFTRRNFAILVVVRSPDPNSGTIPGEIVQAGAGLDIKGDIDFTDGQFVFSPASSYLRTINSSLASTFVSSMLYEVFQNTSTQVDSLTRLIFVTYDINSLLFQDENRRRTGSIILSFLRSPRQGPPPKDLEEPVKFQFQANQVEHPYADNFRAISNAIGKEA